ncbi:hypothetical protein ENZ74_31400, partial [Mesorhizobium sp. M7A.F.Ca.CA.002.15.2.1]
MQNLSSFDGAESPASREARPAVITAHSLSSRPSSSPARMKPEAQCLTARASGPVRLSPATGTAEAAGSGGSGRSGR